ncbi:MAG: hypothetical protein Q8P18_15705, partial [Pseudomonadota bacterium]|nr:hypothetical protein [Pseudomonadota bacterium]
DRLVIPLEGDTDTDTDTDTVDAATLAADVAALAALSTGVCGALIDPWAYGDADETMAVWGLVLARTWSDLNAATYAHADGTCPNQSSTFVAEGDCTTTDDWIYAGTHNWSVSSGGGAYYTFTQWGLAHQAEAELYEAIASGGVTTYVDTPDGPDDVVKYARLFENFRVGFAHEGTYDDGSNGTWIRDGDMFTSPLHWPVSGEMYLMVSASDTVATGDLCAEFDLADVAACPAEPVGTFHIVGANDLTVTFDGDVGCDGCGRLAVDGVDTSTVCLP